MDSIAQAAATLARTDNLATLRKRLEKLTSDPNEQAHVLLAAAQDHGLNVNTSKVHVDLSRATVALDPHAVCALLVLGHTNSWLVGPTWWLDQANLHGPFGALCALVRRLGKDGEVLLEGLERMEPFMRCAVEIGLSAEGVLSADQLSEASRSGFLRLLLTMHFSEQLAPLGEAIWGDRLLVVLAEQAPTLPWCPLADPDRFETVWDKISPSAATEILARGYWSNLPTPIALLERRPETLRSELIACAEQWLAFYGPNDISYGGQGNLVNFIGLIRTGGADARYYRLLDICNYRPEDLPLIGEAIQALPLDIREERALFWEDSVNLLYAPHTPTEAVIARLIQQVLGWKRNASGPEVRQVPAVFAVWGATAAPALMAALDGSRAPFTSLLLKALGALKLPEAAPTFDLYLDHKQTREAAGVGLVALGDGIALPLLEASLAARKKDRRIGAAQALTLLPNSPNRQRVATERLAKEKAAEVVALLEQV